MKKIVVASHNRSKIEGTRIAFERFFPEENWMVIGKSVPVEAMIEREVSSGCQGAVSEQPRDEQETIRGAFLRSKYLMDLEMEEATEQESSFCVALEAGVAPHGNGLLAFTWAAISHGGKPPVYGRSSSFILPPRIVEAMNQGATMIEACKLVYPDMNPNPEDGLVSILSSGALTRTDQSSSAVLMALLLLKNPHFFKK
ncbi:MAG: Inosine/xanthosine triphosphatase [candidate division TM6 bacterium GW2011_GWE2_42_60]|nr:MAG: Inosine/xanthosine triphosphatase [candidate division TM6 bacterium GW2011_GWE2_42_60]HBY05756.1 hypothetical protein [Candidatus Dependentiae bacterium]